MSGECANHFPAEAALQAIQADSYLAWTLHHSFLGRINIALLSSIC
jgi:hypothetical protein